MKWDALTRKLLDRAEMAASHGADVRGSAGWGMEVRFEQNKLKAITASESAILDLRVIHEGRLGAAATNKMESGDLGRIVSEAIEVSKYGMKAGFRLPKRISKLQTVKTFDPNISSLSEDYLVDKGRELIQKIQKREPGMVVSYLGFSTSQGESLYVSSAGTKFMDKNSQHAFWVEISKISEGDFFQVGLAKADVRAEIDYDRIVEEVLALAVAGKKIVKFGSGKKRVIFAPEVAKVLISYLVSACSGKLINEGVSKFTNRLGDRAFDARLTVAEDPWKDWALGSTPIDDEGVPTETKELIEKGVIASFYYDLAQAARSGGKSTGNGFRSPFFQADPGVTNIVVKAGEKEYKDLAAREDDCLVVHQVLGAGQNNPYNGDFQLGMSLGYAMSKGKETGRVKDVSIAGNAFKLLKDSLVWVSADGKWEDTFWIPYICLDNVSVTSK